MPIWPFKKKTPALLTSSQLRDKLIDAAGSGSSQKLRSACEEHKAQVAEHVDAICKLPDDAPKDEASINAYIQKLGAVAHCLANECGAPELWNRLWGTPDDNPLVAVDQWYGDLPKRMHGLEYETLIEEANAFLEEFKSLQGDAARLNECYVHGRLGELLFHSGLASEAVEPFQAALEICDRRQDVEGQIAYLNNLLEVHCYLNDGQAIPVAERLLRVNRDNGLATEETEKRIDRLKEGEPLCRVVCVRDGVEIELSELNEAGEGSYQFQFRRNRISLHKATSLTSLGNELASSGQISDALEKYFEASEVDPFDPDPVYQSGMCLIELGAYGQAREAFEEVERLAPGWFRCRTDRWLAAGLEQGTISNEAFLLLRTLDDGGLEDSAAHSLARQGLERFPDFAPLYLCLGDSCSNDAEAIEAYRKGLALVEEPDLETRLLCALAGRMPAASSERNEIVSRAVQLDGSLVAVAMARLIGLQ